MNKRISLALVAAQFFLLGLGNAASVSLAPASQDAAPGATLAFDLNLDFSADATLGGGFDITYDSGVLALLSFTYLDVSGAGLLPWNPVSDAVPGQLSGLGFDADPAFAGSLRLGILVFEAVNPGAYAIGIEESLEFLDPTGWNSLAVTYTGATGQITAVPVPAALWLMASGLGLLGLGLPRRA